VTDVTGNRLLARLLSSAGELGGSLPERLWHALLPQVHSGLLQGEDAGDPVVLVMDLLLFTAELKGIPL
jgi:hypothetical protein